VNEQIWHTDYIIMSERPWDYIEMCNFTCRADLREWWLGPGESLNAASGPGSEKDFETVWLWIQEFRPIVFRWIRGEGLAREERERVHREYLDPRYHKNREQKTHMKVYEIEDFTWDGDRLEDLRPKLERQVNVRSSISYHLYRMLLEDAVAVEGTRFRITSKKLRARERGEGGRRRRRVTIPIINKLWQIQGREFIGKRQFTAAIKEVLGEEMTPDLGSAVLDLAECNGLRKPRICALDECETVFRLNPRKRGQKNLYCCTKHASRASSRASRRRAQPKKIVYHEPKVSEVNIKNNL